MKFFSIIFLTSFFLISSCSDQSDDKLVSTIEFDGELLKIKHNLPNHQQYQKKSVADWNTINKNKQLRIIVLHDYQFNKFIQLESSNYNNELMSIIDFSIENNLTPIIVPIRSIANLTPALKMGLGDIIVSQLTVNEERKQQINLTDPLYYSSEQLITAKSFDKEILIDQLHDLKIGVRKDSSYWEVITGLTKEQSDIHLVELNQRITSDEKINKLNSGELDAVIEDSNNLILIKEYRQDFKTALQLSKERPIVWGVRKDNPDLLKQLNLYIKKEKLRQQLPEVRLGDLKEIKKSRQLRLITRNNSSTYFLWKNKLMGFEYDLVRQFAKQQKLNLKILIADDFDQMIKWLENGHGDIISSGLIKTLERKKLPVKFSEPYLYVKEIIVQRKDEKKITSYNELEGRSFFVRKSSPYWATLNSFQKQLKVLGVNFSINLAPEIMETEEIIKRVLDGKYDLTLADSHIIDIEKNWHNNIQSSLVLRGKHGQRWLVRKNSKELLNELNKFIDKEYKSLFYNISYNKYFNNSRNLFNESTRKSNDNKISSYDKLIKEMAKKYGFDWRLIAAQVNKESHFDPKAKSWVGASGLLQVMPRTAKQVGVSNLEDPRQGLKAGMKYMAWLDKQLGDDLPADVKIWFTLAAYNAGLGHLKDAQNLASKQGLDPNRWFGHVETTFLLLSQPKYHKHTQYGYVRGIEPVTYIKKIQVLYDFYLKKFPDEPLVKEES
ncbi:MAG: transporter substrate-binding domain-containing protein [Proteobacteria bacterium]|nr:transporter substrate-binding domain-containing protein [Pseudomonadota bacterium]